MLHYVALMFMAGYLRSRQFCLPFRGSFFPQTTHSITGQSCGQSERKEKWMAMDRKDAMHIIQSDVRISNHVKSVKIHCTQIYTKPLQLFQFHKLYLLKRCCINIAFDKARTRRWRWQSHEVEITAVTSSSKSSQIQWISNTWKKCMCVWKA